MPPWSVSLGLRCSDISEPHDIVHCLIGIAQASTGPLKIRGLPTLCVQVYRGLQAC